MRLCILCDDNQLKLDNYILKNFSNKVHISAPQAQSFLGNLYKLAIITVGPPHPTLMVIARSRTWHSANILYSRGRNYATEPAASW